ncbi:MAG: hypothetical protein K8T91_06030 [Planctomycetes bacterium]|nr:hypothetical protein [Planctomycetota bacterium]
MSQKPQKADPIPEGENPKSRPHHTPLHHLEWAVGARNRIQRILLEIHKIGGERPQDTIKDIELVRVYSQLVGAGFSLWRAAFLTDVDDKNPLTESLSHASDLLNKLLTDNTVTFQQDRATRNWMCGYYLNSAVVRLKMASEKLGELAKRLAERFAIQMNSEVAEALTTSRQSATANDVWDKVAEALEKTVDIFNRCLELSRVMTDPK